MDPPSASSTSDSEPAPSMGAIRSRPPLATLPFPAEVRLMVYEQLFSIPYVVMWHSDSDTLPAPSLNILRVSSATKKEASEVLYSKSTFMFDVANYQPVSRQIYKAKTSGFRHAAIKLYHFGSHEGKYERVNAITDRLIRTLTSNCQLEGFQIWNGSNFLSHAWRQLASLKSFKLLCKCKELTFHAETWCEYSADDDSPDGIICSIQYNCNVHWMELRKELERVSGPDIHITMKGELEYYCVDFFGQGQHVLTASVLPERASA